MGWENKEWKPCIQKSPLDQHRDKGKCASAIETKGVRCSPPKPQRIQPKRFRKWMNYKRPLVQKREGERRPGGQVKGGGEAARVLLGVC